MMVGEKPEDTHGKSEHFTWLCLEPDMSMACTEELKQCEVCQCAFGPKRDHLALSMPPYVNIGAPNLRIPGRWIILEARTHI